MVKRKSPHRHLGLIIVLVAVLGPLFICGGLAVTYIALPPQPLTILIMGLDARPGEGWLARSDSVMLVSLDPSRLRVSALSIPRDLFIDVPNYGLQRINTVNMLGEMDAAGSGAALLSSSIEQSFGIRVDRYVRMNFDGFERIIDAVGGVTIDVERAIVDYNYPTPDDGITEVRFDAGVQTMNGEQALIYARTRYADDDYRRAGRQQQVVMALASRMINPLTWGVVFQALQSSADTNVSALDAIVYAPTVIGNRGRFDTLVIDREYITASASGAAVPNYALLMPWISERFR